MDISQNSSLIWRNILKLRQVYLPIIQYHVTVDSMVSFWHEPWACKGLILSQVCDYQQIQQSGIRYDAKANEYMHEGKVQMPNTSNQMLKVMWKDIQDKYCTTHHHDAITWDLKPHSVHRVYNFCSDFSPLPASKWYSVIWSNDSVPSQNLMMWKVLNQALLTRGKLNSIGLPCSPMCPFCEMYEESADHLFFECPALKILINCISSTTGYNLSSGSSSIVWSIIYKATRWRSARSRVLVVSLKIYMRLIWKERNAVVFDTQRKKLEDLWNEVKAAIHLQLKTCNRDYPDNLIIRWA